MQKIKVNDEVIVLAGRDKGKKGKVLKVNTTSQAAIVEGMNVVTKAMKPTQENPSGGFSKKEKPLHLSNISLISPKTGKATRVRIEEKNGKKVRVATKCGSVLS